MTIKEFKDNKFRYIVKGWSVQTFSWDGGKSEIDDKEIYNIFFKKDGTLRKGYVATNVLD